MSKFEQLDTSTGIGSAACCYLQLFIICDVGKVVEEGVSVTNQYTFVDDFLQISKFFLL